MRFKNYLENIFGDDFDIEAFRKERASRGNIVDRQRSTKRSTLELYHGFDVNPAKFKYKFDPSLSEQGLLWFTHQYIRGYNPKEYAAARGRYLLAYPLPVTIHSDTVKYENGSMGNVEPEDLKKLVNPYENCRYMQNSTDIIELPEGWFFTYKHEKFIGTSNIVQANPNQVHLVDQD